MLANLIKQLGGPSAVARGLGLPDYSTVASWAHRGSVPVRYWQPLMAFASQRGHALTADDLLAAHAGGFLLIPEAAQAAVAP